ncbi:MAG: sporulation protein YunB [Clostridia bacterium]|nr:sporulation protein YunB [Clostridia bacterium]
MFKNSVLYHRLWYVKKRNAGSISFFVKLGCFIAVVAMLITYINQTIFPVIASISETKARDLVAEAVGSVLQDSLNEKEKFDELVSIQKDASGSIASVQVNYTQLNAWAERISENIRQRLQQMQESEIKFPAGMLLGDTVFSGAGPDVSVRVIPSGSVETKFKSQFLHAGINQTKHSVILSVKTAVGIVTPLKVRKTELVTEIPVTETIIVGKIPEKYIN